MSGPPRHRALSAELLAMIADTAARYEGEAKAFAAARFDSEEERDAFLKSRVTSVHLLASWNSALKDATIEGLGINHLADALATFAARACALMRDTIGKGDLEEWAGELHQRTLDAIASRYWEKQEPPKTIT